MKSALKWFLAWVVLTGVYMFAMPYFFNKPKTFDVASIATKRALEISRTPVLSVTCSSSDAYADYTSCEVLTEKHEVTYVCSDTEGVCLFRQLHLRQVP